jgi:hypothetical protein
MEMGEMLPRPTSLRYGVFFNTGEMLEMQVNVVSDKSTRRKPSDNLHVLAGDHSVEKGRYSKI